MRKFKSMGQAQRLLGAHAADGGKSIRGVPTNYLFKVRGAQPQNSSNCLTPFFKVSHPQITLATIESIVLCPAKVSATTGQGGLYSPLIQAPSSLRGCFGSSPHSLSYSLFSQCSRTTRHRCRHSVLTMFRDRIFPFNYAP